MKQTLRQRFVGALLLLAIAIILWPVVFDDGPKRAISKTSVIPPQPTIESVVLEPLLNPVSSEPAEFGPVDEAGVPVAEELDQELLELQNDEENTVASAAVIDNQGLPEAWSVQVGAFAKQNNALVLIDKLKNAGFKAYLRETNSVSRVLVGPKLSKAAALKDLQAIAKDFELQGRLVRYAP